MAERETAEPDGARRAAMEARDRVRFEEEALALADQVYRVARRFVSTREEAEDLVQDTYARAFRSWQSYTPGTNLRAWLLRILTNLNVDRGRRLQRRPDETPLEENDYYLANRMAESQGEQVLDQDRVVERLSQDSIVSALSSLPDDFRDVVVLVDIGDFSYADAAQILDIPLGTVMSRLHRGRRLLKAESRGGGSVVTDCDKCEELLQGYLDRELTDEEVAIAEFHSNGCDYCRRRYRFEESLRVYVRMTAAERMPPGLMEKLAQLRTTDAGASPI